MANKSIFAQKAETNKTANAAVRKNPAERAEEALHETARDTRPGNKPAAKVKAAPKTKAPAKSAISADTAKKLAAAMKTKPAEKSSGKASAPVTKLPAQKTVTKNPAGAAGARAGNATELAATKTKAAKAPKAEAGARGRRSSLDLDSKVTLGNKKAEDSGLRGGRLERLQSIHEAHRKGITLGELLEATGLSTGNAKVFVESGAITLA